MPRKDRQVHYLYQSFYLEKIRPILVWHGQDRTQHRSKLLDYFYLKLKKIFHFNGLLIKNDKFEQSKYEK